MQAYHELNATTGHFQRLVHNQYTSVMKYYTIYMTAQLAVVNDNKNLLGPFKSDITFTVRIAV